MVIMVILSKVSFCVLKWLNSAHSLILFEATFIEVFMSIRLEGRFQVCTGSTVQGISMPTQYLIMTPFAYCVFLANLGTSAVSTGTIAHDIHTTSLVLCDFDMRRLRRTLTHLFTLLNSMIINK